MASPTFLCCCKFLQLTTAVGVDIVVAREGDGQGTKRISVVWQPGTELPTLYMESTPTDIEVDDGDVERTALIRDSCELAKIDTGSRAFAMSSEAHPIHGTACLMVHACDTGWRLRLLAGAHGSDSAPQACAAAGASSASATASDFEIAPAFRTAGATILGADAAEPESAGGSAGGSAPSAGGDGHCPTAARPFTAARSWELVVAWAGLHLPAAGLPISPVQYKALRAFRPAACQ